MRSLASRRSGLALRSLVSSSSGVSLLTLGSLISNVSLLTLDSLKSGISLLTLRSLRSLGSNSTDGQVILVALDLALAAITVTITVAVFIFATGYGQQIVTVGRKPSGGKITTDQLGWREISCTQRRNISEFSQLNRQEFSAIETGPGDFNGFSIKVDENLGHRQGTALGTSTVAVTVAVFGCK